MVRRQSDILADLKSGSTAQAGEAFLTLLVRGGRAPAQLRQLAADASLRAPVLGVIEHLGPRALVAYADGPSANREAALALFRKADPVTISRALFELVAAAGSPPNPELLPPLIELGRGLHDEHPDNQEAVAWGAAASGLARLRLGQREEGLADLNRALSTAGTQPGAPRALIAAARAAGELAISSASHADLLGAILVLLGRQARVEAADLVAATLLKMHPDKELVALISLVLESLEEQQDCAVRSQSLLREAWERTQQSRAARATVRQGYFSGQLRRLDRATKRVSALLEQAVEGHSWVHDDARTLCGQIVDRLNHLMSDLLAYQPLQVQATSPRQLILEVATVCKDELALRGATLSCAPPPPGSDDITVPLDPALTKALLRQVLRYLAAHMSGDEAELQQMPAQTTIVLYAGLSPGQADDGGEPAGATFRLSLSGAVISPAELFAGAIAAGTVPDILSRTGGMHFINESDGGALEFSFKSAGLLAPAGNCEIPVSSCGNLATALADLGPTAPAQLAELAVACFSRLRLTELESWSEDLAIVLHDLKNSVAFVAGWLRESDIYDQATARSRCLDNLSDVQFWLSQTDAMLNRADSTERPWIDLVELVRRVMGGLAALLAQRRIRLSLDLPGDLPKVQAEPVWLASALRNLVKNAIEATPEGAPIKVSARYASNLGLVEIEVRDQGPGFPEEILAPAPGPAPWSNGLRRPHLGLSSVRRILAEQGGELTFGNDPGGVAIIRLKPGQEQPVLAAQLPAWEHLEPDARRALVAARALAPTDRDSANHLWAKALQIELAQRIGDVPWPALIPWATRLVTGSSQRPPLVQPVRDLIGTLAPPSALHRTEAAARHLCAKVLASKARLAELSVLESGLLLLLFGAIETQVQDRPPLAHLADAGVIRSLAEALLAAAASIDDETVPATAVERAVFKPLVGLAKLETRSLRS